MNTASFPNSSKQRRNSNGSGGSNRNGHMMEWKHLQPCTVARQDMASTAVVAATEKANTIGVLVVGGRSETETSLDSAELFDWSSKRWRVLPHLQRSRCGCAVASIGRSFYVFGGVGDTEEQLAGESATMLSVDTSTSVESFTMGQSKAWNTLLDSPMPEPRWHAAAVALPYHGDIVVLGGRDPNHWNELDTVQAFDTQHNEWTHLKPMSRPRFACGATRISESILFVAGGYDGIEWSSTCEMYDYEKNIWKSEDIAEMPVADLQFVTATTLTEDFVLVSGQIEEGSVMVMVYQISKDEWTTLHVFPPSIAEELAGSTIACVDSKYMLAVGGTDADGLATKNTRITSNLLDVISKALNGPIPGLKMPFDDSTIQTYRSGATSKNARTAPNSEAWSSYSPMGASLKRDTFDVDRHLMSPGSRSGVGPVRQIELHHSAHSGSLSDSVSEMDGPNIPYCDEEHSESTFNDNFSDHMQSPRNRGGSGHRPKKPVRQTVQDIEMVDTNGLTVHYSGGMVKGRPYGKGRMSWENGDTYSGGFKHGQRHGKGCQSFADGKQFEGRFVANYPHDPNGSMTFKDGTIYVGAFVQGKRTGQGIQRFPTGVRYEGEFVNGKYHGQGVCCFADGSMYDGEWVHGRAHGTGVLRDQRGTILYRGLWQDDSPVEEAT
jgi:N-acetylneuraminic acid mutarotase